MSNLRIVRTTKQQDAHAAAPERTCDACGAVFKALRGPELCTSCWTAFRDNSARVTAWAL